mmetsp:Transcript_1982/g.4504  ORF Transcript_1982/g.4504 Transcript_1982/m.4504 type:complete len:212 (+) Transcript_1982:942-1577(+)
MGGYALIVPFGVQRLVLRLLEGQLRWRDGVRRRTLVLLGRLPVVRGGWSPACLPSSQCFLVLRVLLLLLGELCLHLLQVLGLEFLALPVRGGFPIIVKPTVLAFVSSLREEILWGQDGFWLRCAVASGGGRLATLGLCFPLLPGLEVHVVLLLRRLLVLDFLHGRLPFLPHLVFVLVRYFLILLHKLGRDALVVILDVFLLILEHLVDIRG